MERLISLLLFVAIVSPLNAASLREQRHEHMLAYADYIRGKVVKLQAGTAIEVLLKDGTVVRGMFKNYISYNDTVWIQPLNNMSIFAAQAFNMTEIYDVVVVVVRPI